MVRSEVIDLGRARRMLFRQARASAVKVFSLEELGLDGDAVVRRLGPSFMDLRFDPYDTALAAERLLRRHDPGLYRAAEGEWLRFWQTMGTKEITSGNAGPAFWRERVVDTDLRAALAAMKPYRRRSCFQFSARQQRSGGPWWVQEKGSPVFAQAVSDVRARPRRFESCAPVVYRDDAVCILVAFACQVAVSAADLPCADLRVTLHQMLTYASPNGGSPAPEGRHQDGSDFIVSALVVERNNVVGGASTIYYDRSGHAALGPLELQPGDGILQADMYLDLWHDVSPIYPRDESHEAYRSILGLDLDFTSATRNVRTELARGLKLLRSRSFR